MFLGYSRSCKIVNSFKGTMYGIELARSTAIRYPDPLVAMLEGLVYSRFNNDGGMRPEHTKVSHGAFMEVLDE